VAEGAPLLREYVPKAHRGFESLRLRQNARKNGPCGPFSFSALLLWIDAMAELVADCPRCGAKHITFDVPKDLLLQVNKTGRTYESFAICRKCSRSTVFLIGLPPLQGTSSDAHTKGGPSSIQGTAINKFGVVQGYISTADLGAEAPPEYLPDRIRAVFDEGAKCFRIGCWNAAAAMFRTCVDLATRSKLPLEGESDGPNAKQRRDLGLRLPWLFDNSRLPVELRELATCIKDDGNDGAHEGTLMRADAEDLLEFTYRLLDRMYSEPERLRIARTRRDERRKGPPEAAA
jgi:hypothetical protein